MTAIESGVKAKLFSKSIFLKFLGIAIPSTLQQSFISVGNIIIQRVINGFGSSVMAGYAASVKLNNMVISSYTTIGNGISNYSAQNNGAGKYDRIHDGFKSGIKMVWLISLPIVLLYFIAGKYLLLLFLEDRGGVAMMTGMTFLRILSPFYFVVSAKLVADGILRGTGRMTQFMIATFTDLILRVVLAIGLSRTVLGATGIWCAWPIGWTIAAVMSVFFYKRIQFGHKESAKS